MNVTRTSYVYDKLAGDTKSKRVPGGILTWKLAGETALRNSGLPYSIVRACGLTDKDEEVEYQMEV